ncbi:MAG TPA: OprD family outer membrane porin [Lacibacter sp.]|nr:OprD family outer membrane porin [Lacibacter sp.]HMO88218.1 OprD family outer membrane porin [Lacibacter sp.]HMP87483.1 OprD family outer membrane porin [Lacibacter sp.]
MNRIKRVIILILYLLAADQSAKAQEHRSERDSIRPVDTSVRSLTGLLTEGTFFGHVRNFLMSTVNEDGLSDYIAWGFGAGIGYESARFYNFQVGMSGFFINNVASSDLTRRDPLTNQLSRYELSLFDFTDPGNRNDLDRLEELYLRYYVGKKSNITYGKQYLNTPFLNKQDGRMRPTMENGLWAEIKESDKLEFAGGWINSISPRSTVNWYPIANTIGLFTAGFDENGTPSQFRGNLSSKGIFIASANYKPTATITLQGWNYWVENIFNTAMIQGDAVLPLQKNGRQKLLLGLQVTRQNRVGTGGNVDVQKAYVPPGYQSFILSSRLGIQQGPLSLTANYTRITSHGRFLFPREWGRDPFYTFLARERNEGLGNTHAAVLLARYDRKQQPWTVQAGAGYYKLPQSTDFRLNKYGMPSYYHLLADVQYRFKGFFKGTTARFIYLYKGNAEDGLTNKRTIINRVNMHHFNFILDYWFGKE